VTGDAVSLAFPLTAKYDRQWVRDNALGENDLPPEEWTPGYADIASA
jgi:hypothetical protein